MVSRLVVSSRTASEQSYTQMCKVCKWNAEGICTKMVNPDSMQHPTIEEARFSHKNESCNVFIKLGFAARLATKIKSVKLNVVLGLLSLCGALLILSAWVCIAYAFESL